MLLRVLPMSDRVKNIAFGIFAVFAIGVIVVGLKPAYSTVPTNAQRVDALAATIKCPFCSGESLKDSQSSIAAEYRVLISDRVEAGATDEEIIAEFAANFGDSFILDTSTSRWSVALWIVPLLAIAVGAGVIALLWRSSKARSEINQ